MKRLISIAVALAVTLSLLIAPAVGAVVGGSVIVQVANPIAGELSDYWVRFQNGSTLVGDDGDFIDVTFPAGTNLATVAGVTVTWGPTRATDFVNPVATTYVQTGARNIRIYITAASMIEKYHWVRIVFEDVTNPASCFHMLQVGTSTHTPEMSGTYAIFTAEVDLVQGNNLISLPAYPEDTAIEVVLDDLFYLAALTAGTPIAFRFSVWHYDSVIGEWLIYASDTSFSSLTTMEAGKAYWIKVNYGTSFLFKGSPYPISQGPPEIWCYPGGDWAMIGPAIQAADILASDYLWNAMLPWPSENTYAVSSIIGWNDGVPGVNGFFVDTGWTPGQRDALPWALPFLDVLLVQTEGYFMYFQGDACIIPPVA